MHCFSCDAAVELAAAERVRFHEVCEGCGSDLHVCRNCVHHDPSAYNECRESSAERVGDRERANRCEYFHPADRRGGQAGGVRSEALADLEALFKKS